MEKNLHNRTFHPYALKCRSCYLSVARDICWYSQWYAVICNLKHTFICFSLYIYTEQSVNICMTCDHTLVGDQMGQF